MRFDNHLHVKLVSGNVYDVWWGTGWTNWGRVAINFMTRKVDHVKGFSLPYHIRQSLNKYLKITEHA